MSKPRERHVLGHGLLTGEESMSDWQPIETAPKDGTQILVYTVHGDIELSEWFVTETVVHDPVIVNGETLYRHREEAYYSGWNSNEPTHWLPLPPPPASGEPR